VPSLYLSEEIFKVEAFLECVKCFAAKSAGLVDRDSFLCGDVFERDAFEKAQADDFTLHGWQVVQVLAYFAPVFF